MFYQAVSWKRRLNVWEPSLALIQTKVKHTLKTGGKTHKSRTHSGQMWLPKSPQLPLTKARQLCWRQLYFILSKTVTLCRELIGVQQSIKLFQQNVEKVTACVGGPIPVTPLTFNNLWSDTNGASLKPSSVMYLFHRHSSIWPPDSGLQTELASPPFSVQQSICSRFSS